LPESLALLVRSQYLVMVITERGMVANLMSSQQTPLALRY
jgi:hypothetical protein